MAKYVKIVFLNLSIVVINVIFFSKGFIGATIHHENVVIAGLTIALPIIDLILLIFGNYSLLNQQKKIEYDINELEDVEDYKKAIGQTKKRLKFLSNEFNKMSAQIQEIERKKGALFEYLKQNRQNNKLFVEEAINTEQYVLRNIKKVLNKCILIEPLETEERTIQEYREQIKYIRNAIKKNDGTLDTFQDFLNEVSLYGEKEIQENTDLLNTIQALRTLRGEGALDIQKQKESMEE